MARSAMGVLLRTVILVGGCSLSLAACATAPTPKTANGLIGSKLSDGRPRAYNRPYQVRGRWYTPADQPGYDKVGLASWYSYESSSRRTADGESFDARLASAAHTTLPIPSWLEVTNLDNGRSARVRLNDRGPFVSGRILDLSRAAAEELGFLNRGVARVRVRYLGPAEPFANNPPQWARAAPQLMRPVGLVQPPMLSGGRAPPRPAPFRLSAADEVRQDLASSGPEGLVGETAGTTSGSSLTASTVDTVYAVQAGAFADRRNAERAVEQLGPTGRASVLPLTRSDGAVLYRVLVGSWREPTDAASARARIAALGFADARVISP